MLTMLEDAKKLRTSTCAITVRKVFKKILYPNNKQPDWVICHLKKCYHLCHLFIRGIKWEIHVPHGISGSNLLDLVLSLGLQDKLSLKCNRNLDLPAE